MTHTPVTTLGGLHDKHVEHQLLGGSGAEAGPTGGGGDDEFACPERLAALCAADAAVRATPNCILYSTDTVGGNSGSPVLDKDGAFVAINVRCCARAASWPMPAVHERACRLHLSPLAHGSRLYPFGVHGCCAVRSAEAGTDE